jgi:RHS repeat-associated protein
MAGISNKAAGKSENKKSKYNGYEINTDFDINLYESFYRTHDPQIGRFWQLDPRPNERVSLYSAMGNNPISLNDLLGDTSIYYNGKGQEIGRINRGIGITAVELNNSWSTILVNANLTATNNNRSLSDEDIAKVEAVLQKAGTAYDVSAMTAFYANEGEKNNVETIDGTPVNSMDNLKFNGKNINPKSLKAETSADLVMKNGKVTVGKLRYPNSELLYTFSPDNMGSQEGYTGAFIHTHPTNRPNGAYTWGKGLNTQTRNVFSSDGPSPEDRSRTINDMRFHSVRNVVVDKQYVYLINGVDNQTIKIPR